MYSIVFSRHVRAQLSHVLPFQQCRISTAQHMRAEDPYVSHIVDGNINLILNNRKKTELDIQLIKTECMIKVYSQVVFGQLKKEGKSQLLGPTFFSFFLLVSLKTWWRTWKIKPFFQPKGGWMPCSRSKREEERILLTIRFFSRPHESRAREHKSRLDFIPSTEETQW